MAELTRDLKTISGFRIVNAETVAAFLRKVLLCIAEILLKIEHHQEETKSKVWSALLPFFCLPKRRSKLACRLPVGRQGKGSQF